MPKISVMGELALDGSGWDTTLKTAERGAEHLKDSTLELGRAMGVAFSIGAAVEWAKGTLEWGEAMKNGADRLNITTEEMQQFDYAAKQTGTDLGTVEGALDRLAKSKENALGFGSEGPETTARITEAFEALGVSIEDIKTKSSAQLFAEIGDSVERLGTGAQTTAALMEVMGKGAGELVPLLKELREKSGEAPIVSDKDLENIKTFNQAIKAQSADLQAGGAGFFAKLVEGGNPLTSPWQAFKNAVDKFGPGAGLRAMLQEQIDAQDKRNMEASEEILAANAAKKAGTAPAGPHRLDKKTQDQVDRLNAETVRIRVETENAALTLEQRITEEKKKQKELAEAIKNEHDPLKAAQLANEAAKNNKLLTADQKKEAEDLKKAGMGHASQGDSLTRTGNFLGTSSGSIIAIGERTNALLRELIEVTRGNAHQGNTGTHGVPPIA